MSSRLSAAACLLVLATSSCADPALGTGEPRQLIGSFQVLVTLGGWDVPRDGEAPGLRNGVDPRIVLARAILREGLAKLPDTAEARFEINGAVFERVKVGADGGTWSLGGDVETSLLPSSGEAFSILLQTTKEHVVETTVGMLEYATLTSPAPRAEVSLSGDLVVAWLGQTGDATDIVGLRASSFGALALDGVAPEGSAEASLGSSEVTLPAATLQDWYQRYLDSDEAAAAGVAAGAPVNVEVMLSRRRKTSDSELFLVGERVTTIEAASVSVVLVP